MIHRTSTLIILIISFNTVSLCAASRMWVRHRSVVIVPQEGGLEFSAGLTKKIVFYSCHG